MSTDDYPQKTILLSGTISIWRAILGDMQTLRYYNLAKLNTIAHRDHDDTYTPLSSLPVSASCAYSIFLVSLLPLLPLIWLAILAPLSSSESRAVMISAGAIGGTIAFWAGLTMLTGRIATVIKWRKANTFWDLLLLLPYDWRELTLFLLAQAYEPGPLIVHLLLIEITALILTSSIWLFPLAAMLLLIEWLQWNALGINTALSIGSTRIGPELTSLLIGVGATFFRVGSGLLIALYLREPFYLAVIFGPLGAIYAGTGPTWEIGLLISLMYLSGLELTVRQTFAAAVARLGER